MITDNLPAGMGTSSPVPTVTAQIFASDGITPVSAPLVKDTDFTLTWSGGSSSAGQLTLTMLDTTKIAPTQRLIIKYQAQIDSTFVGSTLTNIAGATRWFSANRTYSGRREYDRTITNGTPGTLDFQDAYTLMLSGYYFQKTVRDLTTGAYPATTAFPGDRLHYTLLLQNSTWPPLNDITVTDNLPAGLGSISNVTITPAGGSTSVTQPSGGTPGSITITGLNLPGELLPLRRSRSISMPRWTRTSRPALSSPTRRTSPVPTRTAKHGPVPVMTRSSTARYCSVREGILPR